MDAIRIWTLNISAGAAFVAGVWIAFIAGQTSPTIGVALIVVAFAAALMAQSLKSKT